MSDTYPRAVPVKISASLSRLTALETLAVTGLTVALPEAGMEQLTALSQLRLQVGLT